VGLKKKEGFCQNFIFKFGEGDVFEERGRRGGGGDPKRKGGICQKI